MLHKTTVRLEDRQGVEGDKEAVNHRVMWDDSEV